MSEIQKPGGQVACRVRITGTYQGKPFVYVDPEDQCSQYIWDENYPSSYWWREGNMSCDCNRAKFLPPELLPIREIGLPCGETIMIDLIEPLDTTLPVLRLDETKGRIPK